MTYEDCRIAEAEAMPVDIFIRHPWVSGTEAE